MSERLASDFLEDLTLDIDDDTRIVDVVIIAKTVQMDTGDVGIYVAQTRGISWIEKLGMLRSAERVESDGIGCDDD